VKAFFEVLFDPQVAFSLKSFGHIGTRPDSGTRHTTQLGVVNG
jgi:hypothetical protein